MPSPDPDRGSRPPGTALRLAVGLQGKHPAFDDFIEGVGADSPWFRRVHEELVFGGVRTLVDAGKWNGREVVGGTPATHWSFLWQRESSFLMGLAVPSSDGRARTSYPLFLGVEIEGLDVFRAERLILPILRSTLGSLLSLRTEADVVRLLAETEAECHRTAAASIASDPPEDYGVQASRFLEGDWLHQPPEALSRVLHILRGEFAALAPGMATAAVGSEPVGFEILRLPLGEGAGEGLAGWLAVLRGHLDNRASLLLIHANGLPWLDVFTGRVPTYPDPTWPPVRGEQPLSRSLACLQMSTEIILPETEEPYSLDPGFGELVPRILGGYLRTWSDPKRVTLFGRVPRGYVPAFPGESPPARGVEVKQPVAPLRSHKPRSLRTRTILLWGGVVGLLVTVLLLLALSSRGRRPSSSSTPPNSSVSDQAVPGSESLASQWRLYREDFNRWLAPLTPSPPPLMAEYVRTNLDHLRSLLPVGVSFEPAAIIGSRDPVDLAEPSARLLESRAIAIREAMRVRDRLVAVLTTEYPDDFQRKLAAVQGTPLARAATALVDRFQRTQSVLSALVIPSTNPAVIPSDSTAITNLLAEHARVDVMLSALADAWTAWQALRRRTEIDSPHTLTPLLSKSEAVLETVDRPEAAVSDLTQLTREAEAIGLWNRAWWPQVDRVGFEAAWLVSTSPPSLAAWTNLAAGFVRGFATADPRTEIQGWLSQSRPEEKLRDLFAARDRNIPLAMDLTAMSNRLAGLDGRRAALDRVPALRRTEAQVRTESAALLADYRAWDAEIRPGWVALLDLKSLVVRERARDFGDPHVNKTWVRRLDQATAPVLAASGSPAADEARLWRDRLDAAATVFGTLASRRLTWPDPAGPSPGLPSVASARAEVDQALREDFLETLADRLFDDRLGVRQSLAAYVGSPQANQDAARFQEWTLALNENFERWAGLESGGIPASLAEWRGAAARLHVTNGLLRTRAVPFVSGLLDQTRPMLGGREAWTRLVAEASKATRAQLALTLALAQESTAPDAPPPLDSWSQAVTLHLNAVAKSVGTTNRIGRWPAVTRRDWLDSAWRRFGAPVATWDDLRALADATTQAGLPISEWPGSLALQSRLDRLARGFDPAAVPAYQADLGRLLQENPNLPEHQKVVIRRILLVSPTNRLDWTAAAPAQRGFRIIPMTENRVRLSRGDISWDFHLFKLSAESWLAVGQSEVSTTDFADAVERVLGTEAGTQRVALVNEWARGFLAAADSLKPYFSPPGGSPVDWPVFGLTHLSSGVAPGGGPPLIQPRTSRFPQKTAAAAEGLRVIDRTTQKLPVNWVSPVLAREFARVLGFRLPTPREWIAINAQLAANSSANLRDRETDGVLRDLEKTLQIKIIPGLQTLFATSLPDEGAVSTEPTDNVPWIAEVSDARFAQGPLWHWRGNLAEILADADGFHLAGGSFLSPRPETIVPLRPDRSGRPFLDVGFRLCFEGRGRNPIDEVRQLLAELKPAGP